MNPELSQESKVLADIALMLLQRDFKGALEMACQLKIVWIDCSPYAICKSVVKEE